MGTLSTPVFGGGGIIPSPGPTGGGVSRTGGFSLAAVTPRTTTAVEDEKKNTSPASGTTSFSFYATPSASLSDSALNRAGVAAAISVPMPFRGSIVAIALGANAAKTTGTARFDARIDGAKAASLTWDDSVTSQTEPFTKGDHPFNRDAGIDVVVTTSADYAPTTTIVEITVFVALDQEEV